jgi:signal peptidase II
MKKKYRVLLIILLWILSVDQWTKYSIQSRLALHHTVPVVKGLLNLTHVRNPGGAFGVLGGLKGGLGSSFFLIFSLLAIGIILFFFFKTRDDEDILYLAFSLVLAGAIGNLIDRFRFGEVIDFFDFYLFSFHWPAFNIADSAICAGMGLIILEIFLRSGKKAPKHK